MYMQRFTKLFVAATMVVATTAAVLVGCKKEKDENFTEQETSVSQNETNLDEYLLGFKKKLQNATKGSEFISWKDAEWNLCALLNFDFDDANYATDVLHEDTLHTRLSSINNGEIDLANLAATYNNVFNQVLDAYNALDIENKSVFSVQCRFYETDEKDNDVDVETIVTTRGFSGNKLQINFGENDYWRTPDRAGRCDGTPGPGAFQLIGKVATNRLMLRNWDIACADGRCVVFDTTLWEGFHTSGSGSPVCPESPVGGHSLYVNHHVYDTCLGPECLSFFCDKSIETGEQHIGYHQIIKGYRSRLIGNNENNDWGEQVLEIMYCNYYCSDEPVQY